MTLPIASALPRLFCALLLAAVCAHAQAQNGSSGKGGGAAQEEEPSTLILSDTLHYDDIKRLSIFTGNVVLTRGLMKLNADRLEVREDAQGNQLGTATANKGKMVTLRQERPETFETLEGVGLRAEYDGGKSQFDLIGQAVVTRYICGKPFDVIRGQRVRYNDKTGTYEAEGGPESSAPGGRVRSLAEPRAKTDAAIAQCRAQQGRKPAADSAKAK
ncbi:lipopolysaccharide transport periplasmic protein LptA [Bordetella genomosp. 13]|uniref:Lipopolysaccharide export system protein LptA n=1 Tax=Bordetella genomosp. 13 TaxID=463040 RepID=A0A1W6Z7W5_9BORD|nr:lipopolysaccharide transport periplasmic protein LptA [Bordetella genomosp. 13]ARP93352.1 lipopolysaccharide transport periplasmic protein LptA [Bordetella genomosp. 13]